MRTPTGQCFISIAAFHIQASIIEINGFIVEGKTDMTVGVAKEEIFNGNLIFAAVGLNDQMVARTVKDRIGKIRTFEFQSVCMLGIVCIFGNHILAVAFLEDVGVGTVISAIQPVVSQTAMQDVFPVSSVQYVVSFSAAQRV